MKRLGFYLLTLATVAVFVSCAQIKEEKEPETVQKTIKSDEENTKNLSKPYGAYLAGRVAHIRRDFSTASQYYAQSLKIDPKNANLMNQLYLILVSRSQIDEAYEYALKITQDSKSESDNFAYTIMAVKNMHDKNFAQSIENIKKIDNPAYKSFISPMINTWNYVGLNDYKKAFKELNKIKAQPTLKNIYNIHAGMINDYFEHNDEAQKYYEKAINDEGADFSLRSLEIISNFFIRNDQKEKAVELAKKFNGDKIGAELINSIKNNIIIAEKKNTKRIIDTPSKGAAEALFSIAVTFRYDEAIDISHMFISLAIYQNPQYELAKLLLADILENREMYDDANRIYNSFDDSSAAYYSVQIKKALNLIKQKDYKRAEILLKAMSLDYKKLSVFLNLGDIMRLQNRHEEAVKAYEKAIKLSGKNPNRWVLYYALSVSYEQLGKWDKAEANLKKALLISNNNYIVQNYLGYSWIKQEKNLNDAFAMIVSAYNEAQQDPNINDSLGWALYKFGYLGMAEKYLEKAASDSPANAVICEHLGDVYWFSNRKNEARFQWQHALDLQDDSGELNHEAIKEKLKYGISQQDKLIFNKEKIEKDIKRIANDE